MKLSGYDNWKTLINPDDDRCEFCGFNLAQRHAGWKPKSCTEECNTVWRDPDAEYEAMLTADPEDDYADRAEWKARV